MAGFAAVGVDDAFGRGGDAHDRFNGDADHRPNPCLGPLLVAPFYAIEVSLGINGTKGGLVTGPSGAVLSSDNEPIAGLYACGEAAAALMGPGYAGSGASLGPALTTALIIGEAIPGATTTAHTRRPHVPTKGARRASP
jgi:3-oxosteroid 1-dehydrogenase